MNLILCKKGKPNMNNYCRNCGNKLDDETKICNICGAEVFEKRVVPDYKKEELQLIKKKEKKYIITIILLFVASYLVPEIVSYIPSFSKLEYNGLYSIVSLISPLLSLSALILLISARITMRGSKAIRTLFNIFIILVGAYFMFIILVLATCMSIYSGW